MELICIYAGPVFDPTTREGSKKDEKERGRARAGEMYTRCTYICICNVDFRSLFGSAKNISQLCEGPKYTINVNGILTQKLWLF